MSDNAFKKSLNIDQLNFDQLIELAISPANVFYNFRNGKSTLILRSGDLVEKDKLIKYQKDQNKLHIQQIANTEVINQITKILLEFRNKKFEKEKNQARHIFLQEFKTIISKNKISLLDLVLSFNLFFNKIKAEDLHIIGHQSVVHLRRGQLISALYTLFCILIGINDEVLLSDIYHVGFFQDISLAQGETSYTIDQSFDLQLEENHFKKTIFNSNDEGIYKKSSQFSKEIIIKSYKHLFSDINFIEIIDRHLERPLGDGYPQGLYSSELSDIESLLIETNILVGLNSIEYNKGDFDLLLNKILARYETSSSRGFICMCGELKKILNNQKVA